jgi:hypothetical protein
MRGFYSMDYDAGDGRDGLRRVITLELAIAGAAPRFCFPAPGNKVQVRETKRKGTHIERTH